MVMEALQSTATLKFQVFLSGDGVSAMWKKNRLQEKRKQKPQVNFKKVF